MAQVAIEQVTTPVGRTQAALSKRFQALAARREERREIRRWLRQNPPSFGRSTGARV